MFCKIRVLAVIAVIMLFAACDSSEKINDLLDLDEIPSESSKAILTFKFNNVDNPGIIDENAKTINVTVPYGTNLNLNPSITHTGKSISPNGAQNFGTPKIYTVTAQDNSKQEYTAAVRVAGIDEKAIISLFI